MRRELSFRSGRFLFPALVTAAVGLPASGMAGETAGQPGNTQRPVVVLLSDYRGRLKTLPVETGGRTVPFLFDTGGGVTLLTPDLAETIGCHPRGRITGYRMSGERIDTPLCPDIVLGLGGMPLPHESVSVLDLMKLLPSEWPDLGGLISLSSFMGQPGVTLDLTRSRIVLESRQSLASRTRHMSRLRGRVATGVSGGELLLFLAATTPRGPIWLLLDSGNLDGIALSLPAAEMLGLDAPPGGAEYEAQPIDLALEGLDPQSVLVKIKDMIHDGVLGARFMENWVFTFVPDTGEVWASPASKEEAD